MRVHEKETCNSLSIPNKKAIPVMRKESRSKRLVEAIGGLIEWQADAWRSQMGGGETGRCSMSGFGGRGDGDVVEGLPIVPGHPVLRMGGDLRSMPPQLRQEVERIPVLSQRQLAIVEDLGNNYVTR